MVSNAEVDCWQESMKENSIFDDSSGLSINNMKKNNKKTKEFM